MAIRIGRTLPPAAAPLLFSDIVSGVVGLFAGDKTVRSFEDSFREYFHVRHCFAVSSGKSALALTLQALHELLPERDEVLIPAYTCYSVPSAVVRAGLKVRLCDLAPGRLDFDFESLERKLDNPRLLSVIPTHLFGMPADVERLAILARGRGLFVVEDAAQATGAAWGGKKLGTLGDVGIFSLGRGKAFTTVEGGVIITDNEDIGQTIGKRLAAVPTYDFAERLKLLIYAVVLWACINPKIFWLPKSLPFLKLGETHFDQSFPIRRLSSFQAGLAKQWEKNLAALKAARFSNVKAFVRHGAVPFGASGDIIPDLIRFPVLLANATIKRKALRESDQLGLGISDGYPDTIAGISTLGPSDDNDSCQRARDIVERIICLPIHPFVKHADVVRIAETMKRFQE